jgi:hypothetical protein
LCTFNGNYTEWQSFWDNFESVIESNEDLSEIDKFSYLRASLSWSAASANKGFPLTGSNSPGAVKSLKERYGDSQKIISTHMDLLINLPAFLKGKDPEEGGSSSQHALQLINIHNHDFSQC